MTRAPGSGYRLTQNRTWLPFLLALPLLLTAACGTSNPAPKNKAPLPDAVEITGQMKPPILVYKAPAEYTEEALKARIQGVVIARLIIDERGHVADVRVQKRMPMGLTQQAVAALWLYRYEPATLEGQPIAVFREEQIFFRLTRKSLSLFDR